MKTTFHNNYHFLKWLLACYLMAVGVNLSAQKVQVHFVGTVYDDSDLALRGALVAIEKDGRAITEFKTDEQGRYHFYLPPEGDYMITITKKGFVHKKYSLNTEGIPVSETGVQFDSDIADVILLTRYEGIDYSLLENPISIYFYDKKKDKVIYDEDYLKKMKTALKELNRRQDMAMRSKTRQMESKEEAVVAYGPRKTIKADTLLAANPETAPEGKTKEQKADRSSSPAEEIQPLVQLEIRLKRDKMTEAIREQAISQPEPVSVEYTKKEANSKAIAKT